MKFCTKCGAELRDNEFVCSHCGSAVAEKPAIPAGVDKPSTSTIVLGVVGIIFAILLPIVTYVCSVTGLALANRDLRDGRTTKKTGKVLNIVALCIAAVNSFFGVLINLSII